MTQQFIPGTTVLLVGTKRGLFICTSRDREKWQIEPTGLNNQPVFYAILDQRDSHRIFAAENTEIFGSFIHYSDDFGETWQDPEQGIQFSPESGEKLVNIWVIETGRTNEPGVLYAGIDPASLWMSTNHGRTWEPNAGLLYHPTRKDWNGNGGLCLHSIVPDVANPDRMWVGISAVGCMRTDDGGQNWVFANKNTRAGFLPEMYPEFGQCIHRLIQHPTKPDVLYQQNHCGIYKSNNAGEDWQDIQQDLPSEFGFPIALDSHHPETLFVVVEDGMGRHNVDGQFTVYRTENAGNSWERLTNGLPGGSAVRLGVLRHGMCADTHDPCGIYVATKTGQLFASGDRGDSWNMIADFMPPIYSVNVAVIE